MQVRSLRQIPKNLNREVFADSKQSLSPSVSIRTITSEGDCPFTGCHFVEVTNHACISRRLLEPCYKTGSAHPKLTIRLCHQGFPKACQLNLTNDFWITVRTVEPPVANDIVFRSQDVVFRGKINTLRLAQGF